MTFAAPHIDVLLAASAALSVFCAVLLATWPYVQQDPLPTRMALIAQERAAIRQRERAELAAGDQISLRTEPRRLFRQVFERFKLHGGAQDSELVQKLRMAGYRGEGPIITFLAIRLLSPFGMAALTALYVFVLVPFTAAFSVKIVAIASATYLGYYAPLLYVKNRISKRQASIRRAWPDALDLLLICVGSGMGIESAFAKVAEEIGLQSVALAEELALTTAELSYFPERRRAYDNLAARTGLEGVRSVVTSLIQAERYGTPVGDSLRVLAQENRDMRMSEAEKKAAALPPKLTVPMIIFFLPVLFAVIITPAIIQLSRMP